MATHPTHKTRMSDSSLYDEVCELCGQCDMAPATGSGYQDPLELPCPKAEPTSDIAQKGG